MSMKFLSKLFSWGAVALEKPAFVEDSHMTTILGLINFHMRQYV